MVSGRVAVASGLRGVVVSLPTSKLSRLLKFVSKTETGSLGIGAFPPSTHFVWSGISRFAVVQFRRSSEAFPLIANPSKKWVNFQDRVEGRLLTLRPHSVTRGFGEPSC